jgi:hypothetical protein
MRNITHTKIAGFSRNCWEIHAVFADSITNLITHEWQESCAAQ